MTPETYHTHWVLQGLPLMPEWQAYRKLCAEGAKLCAEGSKLYVEGDKLCVEGDKLCAEGDKLRAEGDKLRAEGAKLNAEGDKLYAEGRIAWVRAVIDHYGPQCRLEWVTDGCLVNHNELYRYEEDGE